VLPASDIFARFAKISAPALGPDDFGDIIEARLGRKFPQSHQQPSWKSCSVGAFLERLLVVRDSAHRCPLADRVAGAVIVRISWGAGPWGPASELAVPARAPVAVPIAPPTIAPTGPASAAPVAAPCSGNASNDSRPGKSLSARPIVCLKHEQQQRPPGNAVNLFEPRRTGMSMSSSGSHATPRWREMDSNHRYPAKKQL
jgi:hypothetical protein